MNQMIFRSPITRWLLVTLGLVAGLVLVFGDPVKWRNTESLRWISHPIPLDVWGTLFIIYAAMLLFDRTRPAGYALGAILFTMFAISLARTVHPTSHSPKNIVAVVAVFETAIFHAFSVRTAMLGRDDKPDRP